MAKTEFYQIQYTQQLEDVRDQLNRILLKIADRIDRLEGIRGTATIQEGLTIESNDQVVHGFNTDNEI